jgi:hypothetical protein
VLADRLIDCLEEGCFDALKKKYVETFGFRSQWFSQVTLFLQLRAIVFRIYLSEDHPENPYETYTFSFTYNDSSGAPDILLRVASLARCVEYETKTEIRRATLQLLRTLIVLTQTLQVTISCHTTQLFYFDLNVHWWKI